MEKKQRVPKGEKYWYVVCDCDGLDAEEAFDNYLYSDKLLFESGNYFTSPEEAGQMVRKLRAVLNGAEVIEMPSEEEFEMIAELEYPTGTDEFLIDRGIKLAHMAFNIGVEWLKSKIVK